jgi:hypothetical protein
MTAPAVVKRGAPRRATQARAMAAGMSLTANTASNPFKESVTSFEAHRDILGLGLLGGATQPFIPTHVGQGIGLFVAAAGFIGVSVALLRMSNDDFARCGLRCSTVGTRRGSRGPSPRSMRARWLCSDRAPEVLIQDSRRSTTVRRAAAHVAGDLARKSL